MFDSVLVSMFLGLIIYKIRRNKFLIKQLTKVQLTGIFIAYLTTVTTGVIGIYYIGNQLTDYIHNGFIKFLSEILIIIMVLSLCSTLLHKLLYRIINLTK